MASSEDEASSDLGTVEDYDSCSVGDSESNDYCFEEWEYTQKKPRRFSHSSKSSNSAVSSNDSDSDEDVGSVYEIDSNNDGEPIEILEENNNDPNNNMGDENDESHVTVVNDEFPSSPQPGCSRACDVIDSGSNNTDIHQIAQRILQQISSITHESIVAALKRAKIDRNRKRISLSELLPVTQNGFKRPYTNRTSSVNMDQVQPDESSAIQTRSFLDEAFVDSAGISNNFDSVDQPEVMLNHCSRDVHNRHSLSPTSRNPVIDVNSANTKSSLPSFSKQSNGTVPIITGPHYAKPMIKLPDPESNQRKIHVSEHRDGNDKHNEAFRLHPAKLVVNYENQNNKLSKQPSSTTVSDEFIEILKSQTDNESSTKATNKLYPDNPPNHGSHNDRGKMLVNKVNSKYNLNALAAVASKKYNDNAAQIVEPNASPVSANTTERQYASLKEMKVIKTPYAIGKITINSDHQHHHSGSQKEHSQRQHDTKVARKCFVSSINTISNQTAHDNKIKAMNCNQKHLPRHHSDVGIQVRELETVFPHCAPPIQKQIGEMKTATTVNSSESQRVSSAKVSQFISHQPQVKTLNGHSHQPPPPFMDHRDPAIPGPSNREPDNKQTVCVEIYHKLRAMFPNLKRKYISKFCPSNWTIGLEHDVELSNIVDRILTEEPLWEYDDGVDHMMNVAGANYTGANNDVPNVEETCEYLAGIFPDADPHYLREVAITFKDENAVKEFVDQQLKKRNYPTREQYSAKLKITLEQERYTTNFIVGDFVKIFPNPFQYFEDPKRKCQFNIVCLEFLKAIHNRIRVHTISSTYTECNYNMSLATKRLKSCNEEMKTRRGSRETPTSDIPILQEMAFIRYQNAIRKYIDQIQTNELEEFNNLKRQGKLVVCQCCYDDECMPSKSSQCQNGHIFCNSCIIAGTDSRLGDGEAHVPCFLACGSEFSLSTLQTILSPTKFSILLKKRQAAEVMAAGLEGLVSCPFCHFASIPAEGDKVFKCLDPECMKESCIKCKEPNHVPLQCHEVEKTDKARRYIEEKMTQALARSCYKCKRSFFKEEGCNKITCPCGAIMCYLCDKPITDYSHFAGQGSDDKTKCPLWTDNQRLNAETVRKVAEVARGELLRQDPTLVINTEGLKPELPPPTKGPHNQIAMAQDMAVQLAARVMKEHRK